MVMAFTQKEYEYLEILKQVRAFRNLNDDQSSVQHQILACVKSQNSDAEKMMYSTRYCSQPVMQS